MQKGKKGKTILSIEVNQRRSIRQSTDHAEFQFQFTNSGIMYVATVLQHILYVPKWALKMFNFKMILESNIGSEMKAQ